MAVADLAGWLAAGEHRYDAICLDVDNGPEWTVTAQNAALYADAGLAALDRRLAPGTKLQEIPLGAFFGVSRTIVRQALQVRAA